MRRLALFGGVCAVVAVFLTVLLVAGNPGPFGILGTAELLGSLLWISVFLNGCFAVVLIIVERVVRLMGIRRLDDVPDAYWVSGLVSANVAWVCINYLPLLQIWETSWRLHLSWALLGHATMLAAGTLLMFCAGILWGKSRRPSSVAMALFAVGLGLMFAATVWSRVDARRHRVYDLDDVMAAAARSPEADVPATTQPATGDVDNTSPTGQGAVIVLGIDGADWQVVTPLVRAGKLPHFAEMIRRGTIGYLDNNDESFTWRIWPTIFSGHEVPDHGVYGPLKIVLPRTGAEVPNLLYNRPENNSLYGISGLYGLVPSLGLWREAPNDPFVKMVWDVASDYQKNVVVAQMFNNLPFARPVHPVNGAMITFAGPYSGPQAFPAELLPLAEGQSGGDTHAGLLDWTGQVADSTIDLFRQFDIDLGVYYTHTIDGITHDDWNFISRDSLWLVDPPPESDQEGWERLVLERLDEEVFHSYEVADRVVGKFLEAFPDATFVLISDHGWTYSPFLHKGSPDGLLIMTGPGVREGAVVSGARTRDIAPTLAALLSLPQTEENDGEVLTDAFIAPKELTYVDTYGKPSRVDQSAEAVDPQLLERLRALGYIR